MDVRDYVESHAREFTDDLKQWLAIPSISGPGRKTIIPRAAHAKVSFRLVADQDPAEILDAPLVFVAVGLDSDQIHAPNEKTDISLLLRGAEASAYLWEELAAIGADLW